VARFPLDIPLACSSNRPALQWRPRCHTELSAYAVLYVPSKTRCSTPCPALVVARSFEVGRWPARAYRRSGAKHHVPMLRQLLQTVGKYLSVELTTRDRDISHAAVEQTLRSKLRVYMNQYALRSLALAGVADDGIPVVKMRMLLRIEIDVALIVQPQPHRSIPSNTLYGSQVTIRDQAILLTKEYPPVNEECFAGSLLGMTCQHPPHAQHGPGSSDGFHVGRGCGGGGSEEQERPKAIRCRWKPANAFPGAQHRGGNNRPWLPAADCLLLVLT
jgi:hypothetical protein